MKKYTLVTGIAGLILLAASICLNSPKFLTMQFEETLATENSFRFLIIYYAIFALAISLFFLYYFMIDKLKPRILKLITSIILILISIFIYLGLIVNAVFITANVVTWEPLQKEEISRDYDKTLEQNYYQAEKALTQFEDKYNEITKKTPNLDDTFRSYDYKNKDALQVLNNTKTERDELRKLLSTKVISFPNPDLAAKKSYQEKIDEIVLIKPIFKSPLKYFYKCELLDIKREFDNGNKELATERYITLWKGMDNLFDAKNTKLVDYMVRISCNVWLQKFYYDNYQMFDRNLDELSKILLDIDKKMDNTFRSSVLGEYYQTEEILNVYRTYARWPYFDYNKTHNTVNEKYKRVIDNSNKPIDKIISDTEDVNNDKGIFNRFINPVGTLFVELLIPRLDGLAVSKEEFKSELRAMYYVINKDNSHEKPLDNLTGKKFIIKEYKDYYEISTEHSIDGKPIYTYKFFKK